MSGVLRWCFYLYLLLHENEEPSRWWCLFIRPFDCISSNLHCIHLTHLFLCLYLSLPFLSTRLHATVLHRNLASSTKWISTSCFTHLHITPMNCHHLPLRYTHLRSPIKSITLTDHSNSYLWRFYDVSIWTTPTRLSPSILRQSYNHIHRGSPSIWTTPTRLLWWITFDPTLIPKYSSRVSLTSTGDSYHRIAFYTSTIFELLPRVLVAIPPKWHDFKHFLKLWTSPPFCSYRPLFTHRTYSDTSKVSRG